SGGGSGASCLRTLLLRQQLVLYTPDNHLEDDAADAAANQLTGQRADIHPPGSTACGPAKNRSKNAAAAKTANATHDGVQSRPHIGIFQHLAATDTAGGATDNRRDKCCNVHSLPPWLVCLSNVVRLALAGARRQSRQLSHLQHDG